MNVVAVKILALWACEVKGQRFYLKPLWAKEVKRKNKIKVMRGAECRPPAFQKVEIVKHFKPVDK